MSDAAIESLGGGTFRLNGDLDFDTVPRLITASASIFSDDTAQLVVDLGGVKRTTSVGLALMVEWLRRARRAGKGIEFKNVPEQMSAMATVSGLDGILNVAAVTKVR